MDLVSRRTVMAGLGASLLPVAALGERPALRLIYPFAAGGSIDAVARLLAEQLRIGLGRPTIVENRTGAGGRFGVKAVVQAAPDGATLLFATAPLITLQPHVYRDLGYDPLQDLMPIAQVIETDLAFAVTSGLPVQMLKELAAWARANPGQAQYGSPGAGTTSHLAGFAMTRQLGIDLAHVPYRGTAAAMPDLLTGRVPTYIAATPELIEAHRAGRIRIIATTGRARSELLPAVATFREQGVDLVAPLWAGLYAPARLAPEAAGEIHRAVVAALQASDVRARILALGFTPTGTSADALRRIQRADFEMWAPIVQASGYVPSE